MQMMELWIVCVVSLNDTVYFGIADDKDECRNCRLRLGVSNHILVCWSHEIELNELI